MQKESLAHWRMNTLLVLLHLASIYETVSFLIVYDMILETFYV